MKELQNKIEDWCKINLDKVLHFVVGLLLAQLAYLWVWLICLPIIIGLLKELYDKFIRKTGFNWWDWVVTALGVVPVLVVIVILYWLK